MTSKIKYQTMRNRIRKLKQRGLCIICTKPAINKNYCKEHNEYHRRYQLERYRLNREFIRKQRRDFNLKKRLANPKICVFCQDPIDPSRFPKSQKYHPDCRTLVTILARKLKPTTSESHRRAVRAYQERHKALGLCVLCPRPVVKNSLRCLLHDYQSSSSVTKGKTTHGNTRPNETHATKQASRTESCG